MRFFLLSGIALLLLACGQKGPLYMPVPDQPAPPADTCQVCPPVIMPAPTTTDETPTQNNDNTNPVSAPPQEPTP